MPRRPIHQLNIQLYNLFLTYDTFPEGNLWMATEAQLADAVDSALGYCSDEAFYTFRSIRSQFMTDVEVLRKRCEGPEIGANWQVGTVPFTKTEKDILTKEPVFCPSGRPREACDGVCKRWGFTCDTRISCGCRYCYLCLRQKIGHGLSEDVNFPPRCCEKPLKYEDIRRADHPALYHLYLDIRDEIMKLPGSRVYCADQGCRAFIGSLHRASAATMYKCPAYDGFAPAKFEIKERLGRRAPRLRFGKTVGESPEAMDILRKTWGLWVPDGS